MGKLATRQKYEANLIKIPVTTTDEPTVEKALNGTPAEVKLWNEKINAELQTLKNEKTWTEIMDALEDFETLPSQVLVALKSERTKHGKAKIFTTWVVSGRMHVFKRDCEKIYASVVNFSICLPVVITAYIGGWFIRHVRDRKTFLNGVNDLTINLSTRIIYQILTR